MTTPQPTLSPASTGRPLRADARRNRERILAAARAAFAEEGAEVQMESVARRAGVGVGTLYRNFATRQALVAEITRQWVVERAQTVAQALEIVDPWDGLTMLIRRSAEAMARDAGLREVFGDLPVQETCEREQAQFRDQLGRLLRRARKAGVVRRDVTVDDLLALMCGLAAAIARGGQWRCYADVLLDGLRAAPPREG